MKVGILGTLLAVLFLMGLPLGAQAGVAPDTDGDGLPDVVDACAEFNQGACTISDSDQVDTDQDGYGNACDCDFDDNFACDGLDFNGWLVSFKASSIGDPFDGQHDINCDGAVDGLDFNQFLDGFKKSSTGDIGGPVGSGNRWLNSGLSCAGTSPCP